MTNEQLKSILFIDIETAPICSQWSELPEVMQELWIKKTKTFRNVEDPNTNPAQLFADRGGIFSEFSRVVCIGIGSIIGGEKESIFRLKTVADEDEKVLLKNFIELIDRFLKANKDLKFCGHNIKEFDLPFLCRRMIINGLKLPSSLQLSNKKPWEIHHIDTLEMWKFGDYKNYTSLALLAAVLGIPSPKNDIDGSMVGQVFWEEKNIERICNYCMQDVLTTAKVYLHLNGNSELELNPVYLK